MHVLFVEPSFPFNQREFVRALHDVGARVTGIGEAPVEALPAQTKSWLHGYEQVRSVVHEPSLLEAVQRVQHREWVDRLEATVEAHVMAAARVREACGIPGTSVQTAFLCRDKPAMKEVLRQAGVPCAASTGTDSPDEVRRFARDVGYPLIVKPRDAAGAAGTWRVDSDDDLERVLHEAGVHQGAGVAVEEFIEGHEAFYDTICVGGRVLHEFISHYYPGVLEAMRTREVAAQILTTNRLDAPAYQEVREMGKTVIDALGIGTSATHMEWFYGPKGLKFSEIGCRPPGIGAWDLYCNAHEMDVYREWAMALVHGRPAEKSSGRFAAGMVNLRPEADGIVSHYEGMDYVQDRYGDLVIDSHFPPPGSATQGIEGGYMANAWMRLKHPDYDQLRAILDDIGQQLRTRVR